MRSIAIVTIVFLPGTFFAVSVSSIFSGRDVYNMPSQTVFSMTFFNWFGSGGGSGVAVFLHICPFSRLLHSHNSGVLVVFYQLPSLQASKILLGRRDTSGLKAASYDRRRVYAWEE
jgi:hypothetical protein